MSPGGWGPADTKPYLGSVSFNGKVSYGHSSYSAIPPETPWMIPFQFSSVQSLSHVSF